MTIHSLFENCQTGVIYKLNKSFLFLFQRCEMDIEDLLGNLENEENQLELGQLELWNDMKRVYNRTIENKTEYQRLRVLAIYKYEKGFTIFMESEAFKGIKEKHQNICRCLYIWLHEKKQMHKLGLTFWTRVDVIGTHIINANKRLEIQKRKRDSFPVDPNKRLRLD